MTPEPKEIGHQVRFKKSLIGLFKRGWWEIPELMGATGMALIGIGFAVAGCINYVKNDGDNREFKQTITIYRADDPRACRLKNPTCTKY